MAPSSPPDERYSRQVLFAGIGEAGQRKLAQSGVVIIGCGALGSMMANNVVRAGIGRVTVVDRDFVELSNLHRQNLFDESDAERRLPKAVAAVEHLRRINSQVALRAEVADVTPRTVEALIADADLILDGTDNMETRFLINDAAVKHGKPWVYGGAVAASGMTMNILPGDTACLTCVLEEPPAPGVLTTCDTEGVLNSLTAVVASLQTTEAMKVLLGAPEVRRDLLYVDVWEGTFRTVRVDRRPDCPTCGKRDFRFLRAAATSWTTVLCGRNAVQITPPEGTTVSLDCLQKSLERIGEVRHNGFLLTVRVAGHELIVFPQGRIIVKGTTDPAVARGLCAQYIGL